MRRLNLISFFFLACQLVCISSIAMPQSALSSASTSSNSSARDPILERRERLFRERMQIPANRNVRYVWWLDAAEMAALRERYPNLDVKPWQKKTISFAEFDAITLRNLHSTLKILSSPYETVVHAYDEQDSERIMPLIAASAAIQAGDAFPAFSLKLNNGKTITNAVFKGKLSLVNFMFDKCLPCIEEVPELNRFMQKHPKIQVLAMTTDPLAAAKTFATRYHFQWPIAAEAVQLIQQELQVQSFPSYALVDEEGKIIELGTSTGLQFDDANVLLSLEKWINVLRDRKVLKSSAL